MKGRAPSKCLVCQQASSIDPKENYDLMRQGDIKPRAPKQHLADTKEKAKLVAQWSFSDASQRQTSGEADEVSHDSLPKKDSPLKQEEQKVLSILVFLRENILSFKKVRGGLDALSKIDVSYPHPEGAQIICDTMKAYSDDKDLLSLAMDAAQNIKCEKDKAMVRASMDVARKFRFDAQFQAKLIPFIGDSGVDIIIDAVSRNPYDVEVVRQSCLYFSKTTRLRDNIVQSEGISVLSIVLLVHSRNTDIVVLALSALQNFARTEYSKQKMKDLKLLDDLVALMSLYREEKKIQEKGIALILHLVDRKDSTDNGSLEIRQQTKEIVLQSMENFPKAIKMQELGCRALFHLPLEGFHDKVISRTLNALDVLEHGSTALTLLVLLTSQGDFVNELMSSNGIQAVIDRMNTCRDKLAVQEKGCAVLANIINFSSDDLKLTQEVTNQVIKTMGDNLTSANVQSSALFSLYQIALADIGMFCELKCGDLILRSLQTHLGVAIIQEYGCALIAMLLTRSSDALDHSEALIALLAAIIEHSSNSKVFDGICASLKSVFAQYGHDPIWNSEVIPLVEAACYDLPSDLKMKINSVINISSMEQITQDTLTHEETGNDSYEQYESIQYDAENPSSINVFVLIPPNLNESDVMDKITQGNDISRSIDQTELADLGVEQYDWSPAEDIKDTVIKLTVVKPSSKVSISPKNFD